MKTVQSIRLDGYKSFIQDEHVELSMNNYISVLIGKNNSGKSSCIDAVECVFNHDFYARIKETVKNIMISFELDDDMIEKGFSKSALSNKSGWMYVSSYEYGSQFIGRRIYFDVNGRFRDGIWYSNLKTSEYQPSIRMESWQAEWDGVARSVNNYEKQYAFHRINAERDILPEDETNDEDVKYDGTGATNILRKFINHSNYDEKIVEVILLEELNKIMEPDAHFRNIRIQEVESGEELKWEIFLEEDDGRRFALSKSGSGLKTIILMLINLFILPELKNYKEKKIIFAFEELENNLHPALQRKVFEYLYEYAKQHETHIFITTHSHVAVNTFVGKEKTAIYHVQKLEGKSKLIHVSDRISRLEVISDLDVRASDLFQSNGIIWVEGPSDRIYINKWLKEYCNCKYIEGAHYQFLYYGGKLLSHLSANDNQVTDLINILMTNQNAAIVIDSDIKKTGQRINDTKKRIRQEFKQANSYCWITKGKEIENYISHKSLNERFGKQMPVLGQYELFPDYIAPYYKRFSDQKVKFAKEMVPYITADASSDVLDLRQKIEGLYACIEKWNKA